MTRHGLRSCAMPAAASGGAGRIADQSGHRLVDVRRLRASWHGDQSGDASLRRARRPGRSLPSAHRSAAIPNDWLHGAAGARFSAFRGDTSLTSLYAQDSWQFARDWQATLGAARSNTGARRMAPSRIARRPSPSQLAPTLRSRPSSRLSWAASRHHHAQGLAGSRGAHAHRVPSCTRARSPQDSIVNNDPDLAPERSWTTELSAVNDFDHGNLRATLFFEDTRDALYSQMNVAARLDGEHHPEHRADPHARPGAGRAMARARAARAHRQRHLRAFAHRRRTTPSPPAWANRSRAFPSGARPRSPAGDLRDRLSATLGARYSGQQFNTLDNSDPHGTAYTGTSRYLVYDARLRMTFGRAERRARRRQPRQRTLLGVPSVLAANLQRRNRRAAVGRSHAV